MHWLFDSRYKLSRRYIDVFTNVLFWLTQVWILLNLELYIFIIVHIFFFIEVYLRFPLLFRFFLNHFQCLRCTFSFNSILTFVVTSIFFIREFNILDDSLVQFVFLNVLECLRNLNTQIFSVFTAVRISWFIIEEVLLEVRDHLALVFVQQHIRNEL